MFSAEFPIRLSVSSNLFLLNVGGSGGDDGGGGSGGGSSGGGGGGGGGGSGGYSESCLSLGLMMPGL